MYWKNKVVFITGASAGIGKEMAKQFAQQGAKVVITARRLAKLQHVADEIQKQGGSALAIACDVSSEKALKHAVQETIERFGEIDCLVANAGFGVAGGIDQLGLSDFERQMDVNVLGVLRTIYAGIESLKKTKGHLVMVGSVNAYLSLPFMPAYGMSKFAVRALADSIHPELKQQGIHVTLINPGFVESEIRKVGNNNQTREGAKEIAPAFLIMPVQKAVRQMVSAITKKKREVHITKHGKATIFLIRHFPWLVNFILGRIDFEKQMKQGN